MDRTSPKPSAACFGLFEADFGRRVLTKGGLRVRLQEQPFRVLEMLLESPGELVGREEIRQRLWPSDTFVEFDDGLNTAIKKLRWGMRRRIRGSSRRYRGGAIGFWRRSQ